eukprot:Anaeramoba_ignava/a619313_8.p1 GENE.a619313_8~~a619313_8.p1  ORF type:complete len:155 (-),score=10.53 a619313_8:51-515(-)
MEKIIIEKTATTPYINIDLENNIIDIFGKSFPENTHSFYKSVLEKLNEVFSKKVDMKVNLELEYLNSSSLKVFFDIFDIWENSVLLNNSNIDISWVYDIENDIAQEMGEDFIEDFKELKISLVEKRRSREKCKKNREERAASKVKNKRLPQKNK